MNGHDTLGLDVNLHRAAPRAQRDLFARGCVRRLYKSTGARCHESIALSDYTGPVIEIELLLI